MWKSPNCIMKLGWDKEPSSKKHFYLFNSVNFCIMQICFMIQYSYDYKQIIIESKKLLF